jgi:outer membrane biosynthesis protein TonB
MRRQFRAAIKGKTAEMYPDSDAIAVMSTPNTASTANTASTTSAMSTASSTSAWRAAVRRHPRAQEYRPR